MPFANAGGFQLNYLLEGDPEHPVVVLSNSLGTDISMWDRQMPALLPHFRVLRYDTRGHGRSEMPDGVGTLANMGQDILTLLDALDIRSAHLCGVSLGGLTAMWVALNAPRRLLSLVLSNTAAKIGSVEGWKERIANIQEHGLASIVDSVVSRAFTPGVQGHEAVAAMKTMLLGCPPGGYVAACEAIRDIDLRAHIHAIAVPTLVISGAEDLVTPPSNGQALEAAIRGSLFRQVPGAHLSNIQYPEAYNGVLLPFLQQHSNLFHQREHTYE